MCIQIKYQPLALPSKTTASPYCFHEKEREFLIFKQGLRNNSTGDVFLSKTLTNNTIITDSLVHLLNTLQLPFSNEPTSKVNSEGTASVLNWYDLWAAVVVFFPASIVLRHLTSNNKKRKAICPSVYYTTFSPCCLTGSGSLSRKQIAEILKHKCKVADSTCEAITLIFCQ